MYTRFDQVFAAIPTELRKELEADYHEIKHNFALRKFKPSEMGGGHFCETGYRILEWYSDPTGNYTSLKADVGDFRQLQSRLMKNKQLHESVRFHLPNALSTIYDIRSRRGAAHKGKDVNPNFMDATLDVAAADWVMAELVRMLHNVSVDEAKSMVESIVTKKVPLIWKIEDRTRVISPPGNPLSYDEKALVILYSDHPEPVTVSDLYLWTRHSNKSVFRNKVLKKLDQSDMIDVDPDTDLVRLSLLGMYQVENHIPLDFAYS